MFLKKIILLFYPLILFIFCYYCYCVRLSLTKALVKKLETSQRAMEQRMLNAKLKDKIRNTTIRQRTRVTDIVQYVTNTKWKWAGHIA